MFGKRVIHVALILLIVSAGFLSVSCDTAQEEDDGWIAKGALYGLVLDMNSNLPVADGQIAAMMNNKEPIKRTTNDDGIFSLGGVPASSLVYVEFHKDGYCSSFFNIQTLESNQSGQITDVVLDVIPADFDLKAIISGLGYYLNDLPVGLEGTSFNSVRLTKNTDNAGEVNFNVGAGETYVLSVPGVDMDGDGTLDLDPMRTEITMTQSRTRAYIDLQPSSTMEDEFHLLSLGVDGEDAVLLFNENVETFKVDSASVDSATDAMLKSSDPIQVAIDGKNVFLSPNLASGKFSNGDEITVAFKAHSSESDTWSQETISYKVNVTE